VAKEQSGSLTDQYFLGSPDFIIEVLSPGTRSHDLRNKATQYAQHGVREYWAVDFETRTVYCHALSGDAASYVVSECRGGKLKSSTITGFGIEAEWLWQDPLPTHLNCLNQILS
jgi:Uma2 family endonuclease